MRTALGFAVLCVLGGCSSGSDESAGAAGSGAQSGSGGATVSIPGSGNGGSGGSNPLDAAPPTPDGGQIETDAAIGAADAAADGGLVFPSGPCSVEVEDPALPGARLRIEGEECRVETGMTHRFTYRLELAQEIEYFAVDTFGSCGRCAGYTDNPASLIDYSIGGGDVWYCVCDVGCCPPNMVGSMHTLVPGTTEMVIEWPGRQWRGPSDTNEPLGDPFPPGEYFVSVTFSVPELGSLTARLPIGVYGSADPGPHSGASCEIRNGTNYFVFESGTQGIDDPISCNNCSCEDGQLACTDFFCPEPCPPGTAYATSCSRCGPVDNCESVHHGCLPGCDHDGDCTDPNLPVCSDGVCRNLCG